ncbi:MAG: CBS domain-containing protein [Candidatus Hodarchaeota archaeon]
MKVRDFLQKIKILAHPDLTDEILIVKPEANLDQAIKDLAGGTNLMAVYALVDKKPVGLIVKDDVITRVMIPGKDPTKMQVKDIMTTNLDVIPGDMDFDEMLKDFFKKQFLSKPVVDENGELKGILTVFDVAQHLHQLYEMM